MLIGVVVDNFDPKMQGRCKIRVNGKHTGKIGGVYSILDDDLPWTPPAPSVGNTNGGFSIPSIGSKVYVEPRGNDTYVYYGTVGVNHSVSNLISEHPEESQDIKVILADDKYTGEYVKIYYIPSSGLVIDCNGNKITLPKEDNVKIETAKGVSIEIDDLTNNVNITTDANINLNAKNVNIGEDAAERLILGSKLMEKFNTHTHFVAGESGISSNAPTQKITLDDFSKSIKIK